MVSRKERAFGIFDSFAIESKVESLEPWGAGHINDTFSVTTQNGEHFCLQCVNQNVFHDVPSTMENIERVTTHIRKKVVARGGDVEREVLTLVPTKEDKHYVVDEDGDFWRVYNFVKKAQVFDVFEDPAVIEGAAKAFGQFQNDLADLEGARLHETIPAFHDTPKRYGDFLAAIERDEVNRKANVVAEIEFIRRRADQMGTIVDGMSLGEIPERVTHNDTKMNNVLFDEETNECLCVIDLDTVMPGSSLYDFGDAVRFGASTAAEDEVDLSRVSLSLERFEMLARGYLSVASAFLVPAERDLLSFSCRLITLECGMRFLTDHLEGDKYFKTRHDGHNLDRCRTQLRMVADMEEKHDTMETIVAKYL